eukprot:gene31124-6260_t
MKQIPKVNAQYPWAERKEQLFGSYSIYQRYHHTNDTAAKRVGKDGYQICRNESTVTTICRVREYFAKWRDGLEPNYRKQIKVIAGSYRIPMMDHAKYRWLLQLDGQGLSSKLDQLFALGSLVFKEESGYKAYYHHLIKPYEHYIPFWNQSIDDLLDGLEWAKANDAEARRIAEGAQVG